MLRHRLIFGTLMTVVFAAIVIFDGWLDGSLTPEVSDDSAVQGTLLLLLVAILIVLAQRELAGLAAAKDLKIFTPLSSVAAMLFAATCYWPQLLAVSAGTYLFFVSAFSLLALLLYQYLRCGCTAVLANCGANYFSITYLGLLSGFCIAIRIDFGLWPLLMFVFVVKSADIGAYAGGTLFGRHKLAPRISPSKTWEGMAAAAVVGIIVAVLFAASCDIMAVWSAVVFGLCFAFIGQIGDLAESMIKRDAEQKDAANKVPGFGGILDIMDSPLVAGPFGYLFFKLIAGQLPV